MLLIPKMEPAARHLLKPKIDFPPLNPCSGESEQRFQSDSPSAPNRAFSSLTGTGFELILPDNTRRRKKLSPRAGEMFVKLIQRQLTFVDLSAEETLAALKHAQAKAVQGGRVHDLLHAVAAEKCSADERALDP